MHTFAHARMSERKLYALWNLNKHTCPAHTPVLQRRLFDNVINDNVCDGEPCEDDVYGLGTSKNLLKLIQHTLIIEH